MVVELSCCDASFPKLSHEAALTVIADLGIPAVDLCVFAGYRQFNPDEIIDDPTAAAKVATSQAAAAGLTIADVFAILGTGFDVLAVNDPDSDTRTESRRRFERVLEFTAEVQGAGITLLPGVAWPGEDPTVSRARASEELQWRSELAAREALPVSIEPHLESICQTVPETLELLDQAPDLKLTLDHAHFVCQGIPETDIDALIDRTRHVQARQGAAGKLQATAGEGTIDYPRIVRAFEEAGYQGYFAIEYCWDEWGDCTKADCISETALLRDVILETLDTVSQQPRG